MRKAVVRLDASGRDDFYRLHSPACDAGWCRCAAWWVPSWEGWSRRTAADNRQVRDRLLDEGVADGYLLYVDGDVAGWCQAVERDRLAKLVRQFALPPDPTAWAITCFLIAPRHRRKRLATELLRDVVADLRRRGAVRIEAFPKRGSGLDAGDLWNGPEPMFRAAGFAVVRDDPARPILALTP